MFDVIAFDADDTLWCNEPFYTQAKSEFAHILSDYACSSPIEQTLDLIEVGNIQHYGYGIKSFALSMVEAAVELTGGQIRGGDVQKLVDLARQMLQTDVQLFDHVAETLSALSSYDLMLITKGDLFEQERKITCSGLASIFRYLEVVGEKSPEVYRGLLRKYNIDPARFLMVGNSLRSDILPVLEIGGQAVYIPYAHTWFHESESDVLQAAKPYHVLEHIGQLPEWLERFGEPA